MRTRFAKVEEELTKKNEGESKKMGAEPYDMEGGGAAGGTGGRRSTMATKLMTEVCAGRSSLNGTRALICRSREKG